MSGNPMVRAARAVRARLRLGVPADLNEQLGRIHTKLDEIRALRTPGIADAGSDEPVADAGSATYAQISEKDVAEVPDGPYVFDSVACRVDHFQLPLYRYWCNRFNQAPRLHRKQWEWVFLSQVLHERGMLEPGRKGLGFGVGIEPLVDLFASFGCEITATDLPAEDATEAGWVRDAQYASTKQALWNGISPAADFERLVTFRPVNMNEIPADLRGFDFCYSSCSIEHVGSLELSRRVIVNALDTLKPGGISVHTTEFNWSHPEVTVEDGPTVLWRQRDFEEVAQELRAAGHHVAPLDFNRGSHPLDRYVDTPPFQTSEPHLRLRIGAFDCTSFGLITRKGR